MDYQALADLLFPNVTDTPEALEEKFPVRNVPEGAVITRMAPSPTGFVHLGNLVQGLTSERMAHQSGGVLFLRVEDTDAKREVPGAVEVLIDTLKHYGIQFDEGATIDGDSGIYGPYRQRQRASIYHVYAKKLVSEGQAYPCFCTEDELTAVGNELVDALIKAKFAEESQRETLHPETLAYLQYCYYNTVLELLAADELPKFHVSEIYAGTLVDSANGLKALMYNYVMKYTSLTEEQIDDLMALLAAFRSGAIAEQHKD